MEDQHEATPGPTQADWFPQTHWSVVLLAAQSGAPQAAEALEKLCQTYRDPLIGYARRKGFERDAEDVTHGFLTALLHRDILKHADPQRGRFRCFLLTAMKNFLADEWGRLTAGKRDFRKTVSDAAPNDEGPRLEPCEEAVPDTFYDREWAHALLGQARARLGGEYGRLGKSTLYDQLRSFLPDWVGQPPSYAHTAHLCGLSEGAVKAAISRLRLRFAECVRTEVARTVPPDEVNAELRYLLEVVSQ